MTGITCDHVRAAALDPETAPLDWMRRPEVAAHIRQCPACRDWLDAFAAGERVWATEPADDFAAGVIARTAGLDAVLRDLPLLAEMDPGQDFTARVLALTSQAPAAERWRARWADGWRAIVRRPRFAWEAAYVATVCWVLVFGNPVGAIEWSASNIGTVAREHLGGPVKQLRADLETWRASLGPDPAAATGQPTDGQAAAPPPVRAWQAATDWARRLATPVVDALRLAWGSVARWIEWLVDQVAPPPTEPQADQVRSPQ
jgi:hypothetical protein